MIICRIVFLMTSYENHQYLFCPVLWPGKEMTKLISHETGFLFNLISAIKNRIRGCIVKEIDIQLMIKDRYDLTI